MLDTVDWPSYLRNPVQLDHITRLAARMVRGKTTVIGWMPILSRQYQIEMIHEPIDDRNYPIPIRHRQGTSREKVVLNIDYKQCVHGSILASKAGNGIRRLGGTVSLPSHFYGFSSIEVN